MFNWFKQHVVVETDPQVKEIKYYAKANGQDTFLKEEAVTFDSELDATLLLLTKNGNYQVEEK